MRRRKKEYCVIPQLSFLSVCSSNQIKIDFLQQSTEGMTIVLEQKNTVVELLKNAPTKQGEDAAVPVHVRLMFLRIGK